MDAVVVGIQAQPDDTEHEDPPLRHPRSTRARIGLALACGGFYQPSAGTIKIDGKDVRHLSANELRDHFGVVPQETVLFSGSIYGNLRAANAMSTFEQIVQACRMAEIHEAIDRLPEGYETEIGERGVGLSGGQRQRIAIARALLKNPKMLVFDEATSSLDAETAEHFAATVNQLKGKVTMLFITHALPKGLQVDAVVHVGPALSPAVREPMWNLVEIGHPHVTAHEG